jgi:hypothetical protein
MYASSTNLESFNIEILRKNSSDQDESPIRELKLYEKALELMISKAYISNYYPLAALAAGLFFESSNISYNYKIPSEPSLRLVYPMGIGYLLYFICYYFFKYCKTRNNRIYKFECGISPYSRFNGRVNYNTVVCVILRSLLTFLIIGDMYLA